MTQLVDDAESDYSGTPSAVKPVSAAEKTVGKSHEDNARSEATDLRCLSLCIGMLERVNGVRIILYFWKISLKQKS